MKLSAPIFRLKRQARLLARESDVPLHAALNQVARDEGFRTWSHLSAFASDHRPAREMLARLSPGDLVLLGARPGNGKTLMGLELAIEAIRTDRPAFFFTLEDNEGVVFDRLEMLGTDRKMVENKLTVDTSDDIRADHIIDRIGHGSTGAVAIIDYLQLLDQRRRNPELDVQIKALSHRSIEPSKRQVEASRDWMISACPILSTSTSSQRPASCTAAKLISRK